MTQGIMEPVDLPTKLLCPKLSSASRTSPPGRPNQQATALSSSDRRTRRGGGGVEGPPPHTPACEGTEHKLGGPAHPSQQDGAPVPPSSSACSLLEEILPFPHFCSVFGTFSLRMTGTGCGGIKTWKMCFSRHIQSSNQAASLGPDDRQRYKCYRGQRKTFSQERNGGVCTHEVLVGVSLS